MNLQNIAQLDGVDHLSHQSIAGTAFGCQRDFSENRFVYTVVSARMGGLSIGVNMNPDQFCDFNCIYCEVKRSASPRFHALEIPIMVTELENTLELVRSGEIRGRANYRSVPEELMKFGCVALSGDGEPTLSPNFGEIVESVIHLRAKSRFPFFKVVLLTNATGLNRPEVLKAIELFIPNDEIWAKLDVGSQEHMDEINRTDCRLERILENILMLAERRPVIIQSLFPCIKGRGPDPVQVEDYVQRLAQLKIAGAQIPLVQIYSAARAPASDDCGHLPLKMLSTIARRVREVTGLRTQVF